MHSTRLLQLLVAALSASSVAQASLGDAAVVGRDDFELARRQGNILRSALSGLDSSSSPSSSSPSTSSPPASTSTPSTSSPSSAATSSSVADSSSSSSSPPPTSSTSVPPSSTSSPSSSPSSSSSPSTEASSSQAAKTTSTPHTTSTPKQVVHTVTQVITTTNAQGSTFAITSTATTTSTPGLSQNQSSGSTGMSTQTRNTIIGVVVGVGGFIVLCVIGLVAWRVWGRKKGNDENDGLMSSYPVGTGFTPVEKADGPAAANGRSPFQSTLESYHAPGHVNTASNF